MLSLISISPIEASDRIAQLRNAWFLTYDSIDRNTYTPTQTLEIFNKVNAYFDALAARVNESKPLVKEALLASAEQHIDSLRAQYTLK